MAELTRDDLVEAAKSAHAGAQGPVSRPDFERITGISQYHIGSHALVAAAQQERWVDVAIDMASQRRKLVSSDP